MSTSRPSTASARVAGLRERCSRFFDPAVRERGERYHAQGRVRLDAVNPTTVSALVRGSSSRHYGMSVGLDASSGDPAFALAICGCPHYDDGNLCKHVWALVLALDARGWPEDLPPETDLVLLHVRDEASDDELEPEFDGDDHGQWLPGIDPDSEDEYRDDSEQSPAPYGAGRRGRRAGPASAVRGGRWRDLLSAAYRAGERTQDDPHTMHGAPEREAWFVVNPSASASLGGLVITFHHRVRKQDGTLGRVKREGVGWSSIARYDNPEDRRLIGLLLGNETVSTWGVDRVNAGDPGFSNGQRITPPMVGTTVPAIAASGRLVWQVGDDNNATSFEPLGWDAGAPWTVHLTCGARPDGCWELGCELRRGAEHVATDDVRLVTDDGLAVISTQITRLADPAQAPWLAAFRSGATFILPERERDAFLSHFWTMPARPDAELPEALVLAEVQGVPTGCIELRTGAGRRGHHGDALLEPVFAYGAQRVEHEVEAVTVVDLDARVAVRRDLEAERQMIARILELGARWRQGYYGSPPELRIVAKKLSALQQALVAEGWEITVDGKRIRAPGALSLSVKSSGVDWFDLEGSVDFDGMAVALPALLAALGAGEHAVALPDGSQGSLPTEWLARHGALARLGAADGDRLRFSRGQALLLDALLAEQQGAEARVDAPFERWRERLRAVDGITPRGAPRSFRGRLREYQRFGLGWLLFLDEIGIAGCLADDMGLGKTVQVLALLEWWRTRKDRPERAALPSLVVVPRSLVWNWLDEAARFAPGLRVLDYTGTGRKALRERLDEHDLVVTTYGTLRRDAADLKEQRFHYVILDEAQAIKNAASQAFKAARVIDAERRLAVSGTPVENHLGELWALFEFLNPGLLGSARAFESIARPSARTDPEAARGLGGALRPFILRRTKEQVLDDLPEKTEQTLVCELGPKQRRHYDELRTYYRAQLDERIATVGLGRAKIHVLEALLRLRQAACHTGLVDPARADEPSAKLDALMESLRDVVDEGHKALVFSQFTRFLALLRTRLDADGTRYEYLDGRTRNRKAKVDHFQQDPDCPLFLISLKAGGHGLNLTAADYVFILDPWWNPAVEAQAVDRTHRIGQTRPVFAYRLIAKDTVEEKILALQNTKRALAEAVIGDGDSVMRQLTVEDLELLLG